MFAFRPGHQHLSWVALLTLPLLLAFVVGSPIPHPLFGPFTLSTGTSHASWLAEVPATGAWVAWGMGLATQVRRRRRTSPGQVRIKSTGPAGGSADR
jgi:hypothetical protein